MELLVNFLLGILGLGLVVFIHELGHFLAAKACGITVEAFSIGWGKALFSYTHKGTEYRLSMLPLGGYCKMKGEEYLKRALESNADSIEKAEGSLFSASPIKKIITTVAGPLFNLIFAIVILSIVWGAGFTYNSFSNKIVLLSDFQSESATYPSDEAGLISGDKIIEIEGNSVENFNQIQEHILPNPDKVLSIKIDRNGSIINSTITPTLNKSNGTGSIGIMNWNDMTISEAIEGTPASRSGLQAGDQIIAVNGIPAANQVPLYEALEKHPTTIDLTYLRDGETQDAHIILATTEDGTPFIGVRWEIGTYNSPSLNFFGAIAAGWSETMSTLVNGLKSLTLLFKGIDIQNSMMGPLRVTEMIGSVATSGFSQGIAAGFSSVFRFLSLLSVILFFMNLLPIPALDGGSFILYIIEMIIRKPVSPKVYYRIQMIGFVIIIGLVFFSFFNDITHYFR